MRRKIYEIWHYARIDICLAAASLTAASSQVLAHQIQWGTVAAIALATAVVYWMDDLLDHRLDESRIPALAGLWKLRKYGIAAALPFALFGCLVFSLRSGLNFVFFLSILALGTSGFFFVSAMIRRKSFPPLAGWPLVRGMTVSFVWSSLCVVGPVLSAHASFRQVYGAAAFVWMLMFVVSTMWAAGEHTNQNGARVAQGPEHIFEAVGITQGVAVLQAICACSALMTVCGVVLNYFPWQNISVISSSLVNVLFLRLWYHFPNLERRFLNDYMILSNILCCALVIGAFTAKVKIREVRPESFFEWFQFISLVVFLGTVGGKAIVLHCREKIQPIQLTGRDSSGHLEFLLVWGFAIFIFQVFLAVFHLEAWLFPVLHYQLFHSTLAQLFGVVLVVCSLVLLVASYLEMGNSWRIGIDQQRPGILVTTGIFAFTRNPIYISVVLYVSATFLITPSWVFLIFAVLTPIFLHFEILREEKFLSVFYGNAYTSYRVRSPRYLSVIRHNDR